MSNGLRVPVLDNRIRGGGSAWQSDLHWKQQMTSVLPKWENAETSKQILLSHQSAAHIWCERMQREEQQRAAAGMEAELQSVSLQLYPQKIPAHFALKSMNFVPLYPIRHGFTSIFRGFLARRARCIYLNAQAGKGARNAPNALPACASARGGGPDSLYA